MENKLENKKESKQLLCETNAKFEKEEISCSQKEAINIIDDVYFIISALVNKVVSNNVWGVVEKLALFN